ncbi:hypothetical protein PRIPAC_94803 [Pristionchus pacificus]|uniref:Uncharacterized protein n=1 Tax=Pristionchus pacificus TaxID=54126 RepID=A0A2A6C9Q9_PRIPA|nr:hypothetical protein PRIPAC_94803 [Pristionchus pacificus]|eukprot:PDM74761.1 hypothetical protein PRIPAC_43712 [Pristionchus pacificus]
MVSWPLSWFSSIWSFIVSRLPSRRATGRADDESPTPQQPPQNLELPEVKVIPNDLVAEVNGTSAAPEAASVDEPKEERTAVPVVVVAAPQIAAPKPKTRAKPVRKTGPGGVDADPVSASGLVLDKHALYLKDKRDWHVWEREAPPSPRPKPPSTSANSTSSSRGIFKRRKKETESTTVAVDLDSLEDRLKRPMEFI